MDDHKCTPLTLPVKLYLGFRQKGLYDDLKSPAARLVYRLLLSEPPVVKVSHWN